MTRFAAYSSDNSTDEEEEIPQETVVSQKTRSQTPLDDVDDDDDSSSGSDESETSSSSGSDPSEMLEDELINSPPRRPGRTKPQDRHALVEDENGEMQYAHEMDKRASPGSTSSRSSPGAKSNPGYHGDPTVIPWAQLVGVDAQKMHVMQASLFRTQDEVALRASNQAPKGKGRATRLEASMEVHTTGRKHRRDSDGDALRYDSRERASFGHDIEPAVFRPSRKYTRVDIKSSIVNGKEGAYFDAGLSMGRSFRVGWGPGGRLVHLGSLCGPTSTSHTAANSSVVSITKVLPSLSPQTGETSILVSPTSSPASLASKLLQHHLSHTNISRDEAGFPRAYPHAPSSPQSPSTTQMTRASLEPLNFSSFVSLLPSNDPSNCAPVFRLGSALFDPIDLRLGHTKPNSITPELRNRVSILRRKAALSKWLEDVVKPIVDGDLRVEAGGSNGKYTAADAALTYLTGHQIAEACSKAADGGYFKLATLISQAGGDELFKNDIRSQLEIWKNEKLAPGSNSIVSGTQSGLVGRGVWRTYILLAGLIDEDDEKTRSEDDICAGLDWKRVFGLCLWYGTSLDASIADVVKAYEGMILRSSRSPAKQVARPIPKWAIEKKRGPQSTLGSSRLGLYVSSSSDDFPEDPLYALIKLHANPALSLSKALNPLSFSSAGVHLGVLMCWHLYIILSRVMQVRDFADRVLLPQPRTHRRRQSDFVNGIGEEGQGSSSSDDHSILEEGSGLRTDGHSPTADLLTSTYSFELESWGMLQEAAFVLLHIEGSVGREKTIKDLLARSADKLDDWVVRGLVGSLKLPMIWIDEAKAMYEFDRGNVYAAYELYISAQQYNAAHSIAVLELAPDAVIQKDLELLRNLFSPLSSASRREKIDGWFVRGQMFLDYVTIMTRLPQLLDAITADNDEGAVPDIGQAEEIDNLTKRVQNIVAVLPDILHRSRSMDARHPAALEEMTKDLIKLVERAKPLLLTDIQQSTVGVLDGACKIKLIKGLGYARFLQSIEVS